MRGGVKDSGCPDRVSSCRVVGSGILRALLLSLGGLLLLGGASGCRYISDRARDLSDTIALGVSDGGGLVVRAAATRFIELEVGGRKDETFYGFRRRHFHWVESSYGIPFAFFWSSRLGREPFEEWIPTDILRTSHSKLALPDSIAAPRLPEGYEERSHHLFVLTDSENGRLIDEFEIEISASALIAGIQVIVSPGELVDFLCGIFTLDLAGDDADPAAEDVDDEGEAETPEEPPDPAGSDRVDEAS